MSDGLPPGWAESAVGDCFLDLRNGTTAPQNTNRDGVPVSRIETIQNAQFDLTRVRHVALPSEALINAFAYQPGDIAFSHINSLEHVGKTAIYDGKPARFLHGMNLLRLRLGHSLIEPRFAYYFMQTSFFREEVRKRVGHAVNQVSINQSRLKEVPFLIAPIAEQKRIVAAVEAILLSVAACQNRMAKIPTIFKRFREAVLAAACSGRLTADWRENVNQTSLGKTLATTAFEFAEVPFDIPTHWRWVTLDTVCTKITDGEHLTPPHANDGVPILSAKDVRDHDVVFSDAKFVTRDVADRSRQRCDPQRNDILVVSRGATVGRSCRVKTDQMFCLMGSVLLFKPRRKLLVPQIIEYCFKSPTGLATLIARSGATAQQAIYIRDMRGFPVMLPPLAEQHEIVRRVEALFAVADQIDARFQKAQAQVDKLTQAVLAKAFRGELVPTEHELAQREGREYEPAALLLERVRAERERNGKPEKRAEKQGFRSSAKRGG